LQEKLKGDLGMYISVPIEIRRLIENQVKKTSMKEVAGKIGCSSSWISTVLADPQKKVQKALLNQVINALTQGNGLSITLADTGKEPVPEYNLPVSEPKPKPEKIKIKAKKEEKKESFLQKIFKKKPKFSVEESLVSLKKDIAEMKKDLEELKKMWTN
jgi:hypothetical protein